MIPVFAKVLESLMFDQLYDYFEVHGNPSQYGFRKGKSTVLAVESLLQKIINSFELKQSTSVMLCDLSQAFNCISQKILLTKLGKYGLEDCVLRMVKSYLANRMQLVCWNSENYNPKLVKRRVLRDPCWARSYL